MNAALVEIRTGDGPRACTTPPLSHLQHPGCFCAAALVATTYSNPGVRKMDQNIKPCLWSNGRRGRQLLLWTGLFSGRLAAAPVEFRTTIGR